MKEFLKLLCLGTGLIGSQQVMGAVVITALPTPLILQSDLFIIDVPIDMDGNGTIDFTYGSDASATGIRTEQYNRIIIRLDSPPDIGGPPTPVSLGYLINSTLASDKGIDLFFASSNYILGFVAPDEISYSIITISLSTGSSTDFNGRGPLGFEFRAEDGIHYGYFDIESRLGFSSAVLYGWAYESEPGVGILAGQVPEPNMAMCLVTGLGLMMLRRRRSLHES
jgi:hypothetical protein